MKLASIHKCNKCGLRDNQRPLLDNKSCADVVWVGLSAVKVEDIKKEIPLSTKTNSGKLIDSIEATIGDIRFYKTNVVKCLPLKENKIRYPNKKEMSDCYGHLVNEIRVLQPNVGFLLGKIVYNFIAKKEKIHISNLNSNFDYKELILFGTTVVPIHHPSYIQIYKRRQVVNYISAVSEICVKHSITSGSTSLAIKPAGRSAISCANKGMRD